MLQWMMFLFIMLKVKCRMLNFIKNMLTIAEYELRKLYRAPGELFTRAIQPALWLLIFGQVFAKTHLIGTEDQSYLSFLAPGILAQSILFVAIFYGIAIIWERDLGIIHKILVTPTPRAAIIIGKALSAGVRSLSQCVIIYILAAVLQIKLNWSPLALLGILLFIFVGSALFSTFSLIIACIVKTRERFMGIGQVLTMPLFFASSAIYPLSIMPHWLQVVSKYNPLTYMVDALRALMIQNNTSQYGLTFDFLILSAVFVVLVMIGTVLYPRVVR